MATVPYTITALHNEIHNDPAHLGYSTIGFGAIGGLQAAINSLTGAGSAPVPADPISGAKLLSIINANEIDTLTIGQKQDLQLYTSAQSVNIGDPSFQDWILGVFTNGAAPISHAALSAAASRTGSRAEVLWGTGTNVSTQVLEDASPF